MDSIIIGAGLSGLTAAIHLKKKGRSVLILEATDRVGGRVKTDIVDDFRLDHGFQVLLTAYPEARQLLNYDNLELRHFAPGAAILKPDGGYYTIGDPSRAGGSFWGTLFAPAGSLSDKLKVRKLQNWVKSLSIEAVFAQPEQSTMTFLKEYGFSEQMIRQFFAPFYRGIFLEPNLHTSCRQFLFTFKMFAEGFAAVPNNGMEAIPRQLATHLQEGEILYQQEVTAIEGNKVRTADGTVREAASILLAVPPVGRLATALGLPGKQQFAATTCLYYAVPRALVEEKYVVLQPDTGRLINNSCFISTIAPGYAPEGQHLFSASVVGTPELNEEQLEQQVRGELRKTWGASVDQWMHLKSYRIPYALPGQQKVINELDAGGFRLRDQLYYCGDHLLNGSINAAMKAGRLAAAVLGARRG